MEYNGIWLLGLSASLLAGREPGLPRQLPGPGAALNPEHQTKSGEIWETVQIEVGGRKKIKKVPSFRWEKFKIRG